MNQVRSVAMQARPSKPYLGFPLFAHQSGKWAKKIRGKTHYFGRWDDPLDALAQYEAFVSGVAGGVAAAPCRPESPLSLYEACHLFLDAKEQMVASRENSVVTFNDYVATCKRLCEVVGRETPMVALMPAHFVAFKAKRAETCNVVSVGNEITRVKTMLNWLERSKITGKIETGPDFRKPSEKTVRRHRRERGRMMFDAGQLRAILDESGVQLRAMVLLGINCGFQNSDLENVSVSAVQGAVETGWIEFPRLKTEVDRRCPLWKVTRSALTRSMAKRPESMQPEAFLRPDGRQYSAVNHDLAKRFRAARDHALIDRGGFSWLRKTFATAAAGAKDKEARDYIMGHADPSMSALYVQEVWDDRLIAVTQSVLRWIKR